jgi:glucose/mannose-6-phosphate isomerase
MRDLDAPDQFARSDPKGMLTSIAELPEQCEHGWSLALQLGLPDAYRRPRQIVLLGVGGSAIGGDLLRTLVVQESPVPILVHRDYALPAFVDRSTVVVVSSYSGNTEEALLGFEAALQRAARVMAITTGGELSLRANERGLPLWTYNYQAQPRAALGYSLMFLLGAIQHMELVSDKSGDVAEATAVMRQWQSEIKESVPEAENRAKQLARRLYHRLPVVYAAEHLSEVARRWKGQFNENSKSWGVFDVLPELDHNTVVGYPLPPGLSRLAHVVMLTSPVNHPRVLLRFDITRELLEGHGYSCDLIESRGQSLLAQMLSTIHFGDYVSFYLAMLNGVDPWAIGNIEFVKSRLKGSQIEGPQE